MLIDHLRFKQPITKYSYSKKSVSGSGTSRKGRLAQVLFGSRNFSNLQPTNSNPSFKSLEKTDTISSSASTFKYFGEKVPSSSASTSPLPEDCASSSSTAFGSSCTADVPVSLEARKLMIESLKGMDIGAPKSILKNTSLSDLTTDLLRYLEEPLPPKRVQWSGATGVTAEYSWEDYFRRQTIRRVHNLAYASSDSSSIQQQRISGDSRISMDSVELELDHENVRPRHKHSVENFQQQKREIQEESENSGDFELAELEKGADIGSMDAIEVQDDFAFLLVEDCEDSSDDDNIPLATILSKVDFVHSANLPIVPEKPSSHSHSSQNMQGVVGKLQLNRKSNFIIERQNVLAVETSTVPFPSPQECHTGERDSLDFHDRSSIELFRVQPLIIA